MSLTLAAEEIFSYLAGSAVGDQDLRIQCRGSGYQVTATFTLPGNAFDLRAFNLTSRTTFSDDQPTADLGLLIAARSVDRLEFQQKAGEFQLVMGKDRAYPAPKDMPFPQLDAVPAVTVRTPDAAELHLLLHGLRSFQSGQLPPEFAWPGKVMDMATAGVYHTAIAVDPAGRLGGGLLWRQRSKRLVECYGPYLFGQPAATADLLLDRLLGALARTPAIPGLFPSL